MSYKKSFIEFSTFMAIQLKTRFVLKLGLAEGDLCNTSSLSQDIYAALFPEIVIKSKYYFC